MNRQIQKPLPSRFQTLPLRLFLSLHFSADHLVSQSLQPTIVVVTNVPRLFSEPFTDFVDREPFEEMKLQSNALFFREVIKGALQIGLPIKQLRTRSSA